MTGQVESSTPEVMPALHTVDDPLRFRWERWQRPASTVTLVDGRGLDSSGAQLLATLAAGRLDGFDIVVVDDAPTEALPPGVSVLRRGDDPLGLIADELTALLVSHVRPLTPKEVVVAGRRIHDSMTFVEQRLREGGRLDAAAHWLGPPGPRGSASLWNVGRGEWLQGSSEGESGPETERTTTAALPSAMGSPSLRSVSWQTGGGATACPAPSVIDQRSESLDCLHVVAPRWSDPPRRRLEWLAEAHRVVRPGGSLAFSFRIDSVPGGPKQLVESLLDGTLGRIVNEKVTIHHVGEVGEEWMTLVLRRLGPVRFR